VYVVGRSPGINERAHLKADSTLNWSSPSFVDTWLIRLGGDLTLKLHRAHVAEC